jgi:hypothetical protein
MTDSGNNHKRIVLMVDIESQRYHRFVSLLEDGVEDGIVDGFYFLTVNGSPVQHRDQHLESENALGRKIAAIQRDGILHHGMVADIDPETGIEYGELT